MQKVRMNHTLEAAVNKGIAATLMSGVLQGVKVMKDNGVPIHTALRVVLSPQSRRSTDCKN